MERTSRTPTATTWRSSPGRTAAEAEPSAETGRHARSHSLAGARRVLSRRPRPAADGITCVTGDLLAGEAVEAAVVGARTVLHLAGGPKGDDAAAGVRHLVYLSVIGADRVPPAWLRSKRDAERAIAESGIPWTTLRATQFHDLALGAPVGPVPDLPVRIPRLVGQRVHMTADRLHGTRKKNSGPGEVS
ncbi:SDR family oxidoreductase [Streptomyces shenzhenensis]|uniref:SDR family oxidoreductase n=1 Tax=Streptomyces shenzhenensis TaxID=943815 RepID=UPI0037F7313D